MKKTAPLLAGMIALGTLFIAGNASAQTANPNEVFQNQNNDPFSRTNDSSSNVMNLMNRIQMGTTMDSVEFNNQQRRNLNSATQKFRQLQLERMKLMNQTPASPTTPAPATTTPAVTTPTPTAP